VGVWGGGGGGGGGGEGVTLLKEWNVKNCERALPLGHFLSIMLTVWVCARGYYGTVYYISIHQYIYIYVYVCIHLYIRTHIYIYVYICAHIHILYTYMCICISMSMYICARECESVCV